MSLLGDISCKDPKWVAAGKKAWRTRKQNERKRGLALEKLSDTPGKQAAYAALRGEIASLSHTVALTLPGVSDEFESSILGAYPEMSLYVIERDKDRYENVKENFCKGNDDFRRRTKVAHANLANGMLSQGIFKSLGDGEKEYLSFPQLCAKTNFVWLDFMGGFSPDYAATAEELLTQCTRERLVFGITVGQRCVHKSWENVEEFIYNAAPITGWHTAYRSVYLEYRSKTRGRPYYFHLWVLEKRARKSRKHGRAKEGGNVR